MNLFHNNVIELRHLRLVRALAREGSLVRAAPSLHLTQSALSHQLLKIEEAAGSRLFVRTRKSMQLTAAGRRLLSAAETVFNELDATGRDLAAMQGTAAGSLRVSTECTTCYHWLPDVMTALSRKFPSVEVEIDIEASRRPLQALLSGELDAAIVYSERNDRRLSFRQIFKDELVIIVSPKHRLASKQYVEAADFAGEVLLYYGGVDDDSTVARQILAPAGVRPAKLKKVPLTEAIIEMVKAGHGVSMIPNWSALPYVRSGELAALRLTRKGVFRHWKLALRATQTKCDYLVEFGDLLARQSFPAKIFKSGKQVKTRTRR
jgi:LysR family transcriptional regulator, regulator for metE and metH